MLVFLITIAFYALCMLLAYALGRWFTWLAMGWATRHNVVSAVTARSSHSVPTPRLGGAGMAAGFGCAAAFFLIFCWRVPHEIAALGFNPYSVAWLLAGWAIMLLVGLLDDVFDLPPLVKLSLMLLAALVPTLGGGLTLPVATSHIFPDRWHAALMVAVSVLWLLFFTNGYNFMDGMDGFAANFARFAASAMFLGVLALGLVHGNLKMLRVEAYLLPLLAMACWGFLHWNRPPARVFMGDGGSLSNGYLLAMCALLGERYGLGIRLPFICSATILMPYLFDVILTLARRARRGENLLKAHREHLYQRLLRSGMTHAQVLRINLWLFFACGLLGVVSIAVNKPAIHWLAATASLAIMSAYWSFTLRRERSFRTNPMENKTPGDAQRAAGNST